MGFGLQTRTCLISFAAFFVLVSLAEAPMAASRRPQCKPPVLQEGLFPISQRKAAEAVLADLRSGWRAQGLTLTLRPDANGGDSAAIDRALRAAREARDAKMQPVTLRFEPGRYRLSRPIVLTTADSGMPGAPLRFEAAPGGPVVLSGSLPLNRQALPQRLRRLLPYAVQSRVDGYAVPAQAVPPVPFPQRVGSTGLTRSPSLLLFQGDRPLWRSAWPNDDFATQQIARPQPGPVVSPEMVLQPALPNLAQEPALQAGGYWTFDWAYEENSVSLKSRGAKRDGSQVLVMPPLATRYAQSPQMRYRLLGGFSFLDRQGEMAYDDGAAAVYSWPGDALVEAAVVDQLVTVSAAHDIRFDGLAFEGSRHDLIAIIDSRDIAISNAYLGLAAGSGMTVSRSEAVVLERSVVSDLGEVGVAVLRDPQRPSGHILVADNIFTRTSALTRGYRPAVQLNGADNIVMGNAISELPHVAIIFAGVRNLILGNEIFAVDQETGDAGAIYAFHDLTTSYNTIAENYLHDIGLKSALKYAGLSNQIRSIYLDSWTSYTNIYNNLTNTESVSYWINGGYRNLVDSNIWFQNGEASGEIYDISHHRRGALGTYVFETPGSGSFASCSRLADRFDPAFLHDGVARENTVRDNFNIGGRSAAIPPKLAALQQVSNEHEIPSQRSNRRRSFADLLDDARRFGAPVGSSLAAADRTGALSALRYRERASRSLD